MHAFVVINPVSGSRARARRAGQRAEDADVLLRACGAEPRVHVTRAPGDAREATRRAVRTGVDVVIAWGGDGTVNEVASELVGTGVPLGIVPSGSGNGLARELRVPRRHGAALAHAVTARPRRLDVGEMNGRTFVNVAGVGLDAAIAYRFNALRRKSRGLLTYALVTLEELRTFQPMQAALEADGMRFEAEAVLVTFCNSGQYGNGALIAPGACPDDGLLDLVAVGSDGVLPTLWRARRLFTGTILRDPRVRHERVRAARLTTALPVASHVDGEPAGVATTFEVRVRPGALLVNA